MNRKNGLVFICALVALVLALTLGSCGSHAEMPSESVPKTTQPAPTIQTEPATEAVTELETEATTQPTTVPQETEPPASSGIQFISWPETVAPGKMATVTVLGQPNTQYSITVNYKSGPSTAGGLESQTSDAEGYASWTWRVGSRTSSGTFDIEVSGGGERESVKFTIAE